VLERARVAYNTTGLLSNAQSRSMSWEPGNLPAE